MGVIFLRNCWGLSFQKLESFLRRDFDLPKRSAGSEEDIGLANRLFEEFKMLNMDPRSDVHYVQLQTPDRLRWQISFN